MTHHKWTDTNPPRKRHDGRTDMKYTCWEDAAEAAMDQLFDEAVEFLPYAGNHDYLYVDDFAHIRANGGHNALQYWLSLGCIALCDYALTNRDQFCDGVGLRSAGSHILQVVISKQRDYGHGNINAYGMVGVEVRVSDKIERLKHLREKQGREPQPTDGPEYHADHAFWAAHAPANEPIEDTLLDLVGYSVIALMLIRGTFDLDLAPSVAEQNRVDTTAAMEPESAPLTQEQLDDFREGVEFDDSTSPERDAVDYDREAAPYEPTWLAEQLQLSNGVAMGLAEQLQRAHEALVLAVLRLA